MLFCWICSYVLINPLAGLQLVSGWTTLSLEGKQDIQKKRSPFCTGLETSMSWEPWFLPLLSSKPRLPLGESLGFPFRWREIQPQLLQHLPSILHPTGPPRKSCTAPGGKPAAQAHSFLALVLAILHMEIWSRRSIAEWVCPFQPTLTRVRHVSLAPHCKCDLTCISLGCKFWHWESHLVPSADFSAM